MITYLKSKLWGSKWLVICLIIGNILLVGIVAGTPIYITATMQRIFQHDLMSFANTHNTFPAVMQLRFSFNGAPSQNELLYYDSTTSDVLPWVNSSMGVPSIGSLSAYLAVNWEVEHMPSREYALPVRMISMLGIEDYEHNVRLTHGRMPSSSLVDGNIIEALAHETTMSIVPHVFEELMVFPNKDNLYFRIVGVFTVAGESEAFWSLAPINFRTATFLVSDNLLYERFVRNYSRDYNMVAYWITILDPTELHVQNISHYLSTVDELTEALNYAYLPIWAFSLNFLQPIMQTYLRDDNLGMTLWVLQIHVFLMLAIYIYMVNRQILQIDTNEISVLRSRGASRKQILQLYLMQGIFISAVSFPLGIALGVGICHVLGASNGFLELVQRETLDVVITNEALLYAGGALFLSFLTMFIPVIRFSRVDVVENKLTKRGKPIQPFWQRYFLDFLFFGAALYGLYTYGNLQELLDAALLAESPSIDPLLYISSSLFVIGVGLICLRIFPFLMKLVFTIGRRFWSPSMYVSMLKIIRSTGEEKFIMLFLIISVSIGIYNAQVARTINLNNEHLVRYMGGTDLIFREVWETNAPIEDDGPPPERLIYTEPDFDRYRHFEEVDAMTRVIQRTGSVRHRGRTANDVRVMNIETDTFSETAWFRDDLLRIHMNYFLNALALQPNGILLSDNFRTQLGFYVGEEIEVTENDPFGTYQNRGHFVIVGFVDFWPNFAPVTRERLPTLEFVERPAYLAVVNLGYTAMRWGMRPYQIWMNTNTTSSLFFRDFIEENEIRNAEFHDTNVQLAAVMNDPLVQGTNGLLTVGFIVILIICFFGFLIYWILSIRSRVLQFGIFRAMGLSMRNIIRLLIYEHGFITLSAIGIGAFVGIICSRLFVPLIQVAYTAAEQVIPILIVVNRQDYLNIFVMLGATILICMVILIGYISKIKIDQALKLGED